MQVKGRHGSQVGCRGGSQWTSFSVHVSHVSLVLYCNAPSNVIEHLRKMHTHARHHKTVFSQRLTHRRLHTKEEKLSSTLLAGKKTISWGEICRSFCPNTPMVALE